MNCIRIPINHRHFMDDMNPSVIKPEGFRLVDRIVEACASEGLYTIIDLHTCPGGQNQGWHSDSGIHKALFWDFKDFQDRVIQLWVALAEHYKDNTWVAGYNPMNEPADPLQYRLQDFYARIEPEIRRVDPHHVLFLDGNTYAMDFSFFKTVLPNSVYAIHDYSNMGFPSGDAYVASDDQKSKLKQQFQRKIEFMEEHKVPVWNGEFGPVYASPDESNADTINSQRYNLLGQQLSNYKQASMPIHWSVWLYKDIGFQGMVYVSPDTPYMKRLKPWLEKKKRMGLDKWGRDDTHVRQVYEPLIEYLKSQIPEEIWKERYPKHWGIEGHVHRVLRENLISEYLTVEYAKCFEGMSNEQLDAMAKSFHLDNCVQRKGLNEILRKDAEK